MSLSMMEDDQLTRVVYETETVAAFVVAGIGWIRIVLLEACCSAEG